MSETELIERVQELEQRIHQAKVLGTAIALGILVAFGISWYQIPEIAVRKALEEGSIKKIEEEAERLKASTSASAASAQRSAGLAEQAATEAEQFLNDLDAVKYVTVKTTSVPGETRSFTAAAACPTGFKAVGGGFNNDLSSRVDVVQMGLRDNTFLVSFDDRVKGALTIEAWAACLRSKPKQ